MCIRDRKRGLLPELEVEMNIVRASIMGVVSKIVRHGYTAKEMADMLKGTGFRDIEEFPNPYFGQCYSLLARK